MAQYFLILEALTKTFVPMKTILFIAAAATLLAFTVVNYEVKNNTAEVEQIEGLYVFTDSKPVKEYEYLGTVKANWTWSSKYEGIRSTLISKTKKDFPTAQGIILTQTDGTGPLKCDAIKFK